MRWRSRPGAWAPAARALPASRDPASRAISSTSSKTAASIQQLTRATPTVSPAFSLGQGRPTIARCARQRPRTGLGFDAVNSNTFQDQAARQLSYKFGSLTHADKAMRAAGHRAQSRMHRDRPEARLDSAHRVDRRWLEFRRPVQPQLPPSTAIIASLADDLCRPARGLAGLSRAQAL